MILALDSLLLSGSRPSTLRSRLPMSTDFFQRQADARRTTKWLVILFFLAVVGIVGTVVVATTAALHGTRSIQQLRIHPEVSLDTVGIPLGAGAFSLALIGTGSLVKLVQLRGGGTTVAESLGGRRLNHNTTDPLERRVVNIVEEMALASGVPVPPVYFLSEEQGINAFAAGYSPSDAVVAVTRGTAEQLTRDELQGVIAHEFSHILNGDMRLNIRLIGVLHGILLLGLLGRMLFNIASRGGGSRRSGKDGGLYLLFIGLALLIVGYLGTFFGNLIKAAVSRQREYLADASAVQFTRNPEGIAGALKRIGAAVFGSRLSHPKAAELSHMYFGQGVWEGFTGMMATHPSLEKRILALEPNWNGVFPSMPQIAAAITELENVAGFVGRVAQADEVPVEVVRHSPDQVGNPTEQHRGYAAQLIENIPTEILEAVREPYGARAVMFALLLDPKAEVRERQFAALTEHMPADVVEFTETQIGAMSATTFCSCVTRGGTAVKHAGAIGGREATAAGLIQMMVTPCVRSEAITRPETLTRSVAPAAGPPNSTSTSVALPIVRSLVAINPRASITNPVAWAVGVQISATLPRHLLRMAAPSACVGAVLLAVPPVSVSVSAFAAVSARTVSRPAGTSRIWVHMKRRPPRATGRSDSTV